MRIHYYKITHTHYPMKIEKVEGDTVCFFQLHHTMMGRALIKETTLPIISKIQKLVILI